MDPYTYYSPPTAPPSPPPPPPPASPMCNYTMPPPPPPPPTQNPCSNGTTPPPPPITPPPPPPPPPPPTPITPRPPPPPPPPPLCECVCPPYNWPPQHWAPPPHYSMAPSPQQRNNNDNHTTYIAVFVSLGGVFFLAFMALGLFCLARRRKKAVMIPAEAEACVEEHEHIQETITTGPCGEQTVTVTIDDDRRIHEIAEARAVEGGSSSHAQGYHHHKNG
ncbi:hypothetical protein P3X46_021261 [Hevea brasiliensis]|uniref:Uncharacterized protein n=1 Tax=Hevea brasiliensis TaxID=3981 RepID=A0ABQ9LIJ6_HEVBR|nr:protein TRACHEARY ELEMENT DIFFERENTIATION-RELATED 7A-like [Hevea brasiliensis]KAJ9166521.1 hypothetical protein P3X46_021261 [Hevea brasiliensis]